MDHVAFTIHNLSALKMVCAQKAILENSMMKQNYHLMDTPNIEVGTMDAPLEFKWTPDSYVATVCITLMLL